MAQKVTAMDIRAAAALAGQIDNVSQFCRDRQISRQTFYKYRRRFGVHGLAGLQEQSRRPNSSPGQTPAAVEETVLRQRKQLLEQGLDHGPQSIVWALERDGMTVPSRSMHSWSTDKMIFAFFTSQFFNLRPQGFQVVIGQRHLLNRAFAADF